MGGGPAAGVAEVAGRVGPGRCAVGRPGVLRPVRAVLRSADRSSVDADGDVSAVDVPEVPVPAGVRVVVPGGGDSFTWRRFCRIPFDGAVPHPTTLMKLTTRCGSTAVDGLNEALLAKAAEAKVLRTNRVRADTTVIPANVSYPTDSGLLAKAVRRIGTDRAADPRRRRRGPHDAAGPVPGGRQQGARHRREAAVPRPTGARPGQGQRAADHRGARRPRRGHRPGRGTVAGQRPTSAAPGADQGRRPRRRRGSRCGRGTASGSTGPRREGPVRPAGCHRQDRRADPATDRRDHPGRFHPGGQPARPQARPIAKGRLGQTRRVRLQGAGCRQRRRHRRGPRRAGREPADASILRIWGIKAS